MSMQTPGTAVPPTDATPVFLQVAPHQIVDLYAILEGYDDLCVVLTRRPREGNVEIRVTPGAEDEVRLVLEALGREGLPTTVVEES